MDNKKTSLKEIVCKLVDSTHQVGSSGGSCEYGNKHSGSLRKGIFMSLATSSFSRKTLLSVVSYAERTQFFFSNWELLNNFSQKGRAT